MQHLLPEILKLLAQGRPQSLDFLASSLAVSDTLILNELPSLADHGVQQHKEGYLVLPGGLELLAKDKIARNLSAEAKKVFKTIHVFDSLDSTNEVAIQHGKTTRSAAGGVWLAEQQVAGRGRLGRQWQSPFASNLYLTAVVSMGLPEVLQGISLVVGVAVIRALLDQKVTRPRLKWPNDLLHDDKKLGGILVESPGNGDLVLGIGLNVRMPDYAAAQINQPWTDLHQLLSTTPSRNLLASSLLNHLTVVIAAFRRDGLMALKSDWEKYDAFYDRVISVKTQDKEIYGLAKGINDKGELQVEIEGQLRCFSSGEISIRVETPDTDA